MSTRQQGIPQDAPEASAIADYLRKHPEFFVTHAELLAAPSDESFHSSQRY